MLKQKTKACLKCGAEITKGMKNCPQCGEKTKKPLYRRLWFIILIILLLLGSMFGGKSDNQTTKDSEGDNIESSSLDFEKQFAEDNDTSSILATNIITACESIGISKDNISSFTQTDDWADGKRYTIAYEGYQFLIYVNSDETINSINSGQARLYENGVAKVNVNDKLVTTSQNITLTSQVKDDVINNLKAPSTAKFPGTILEADQWIVSRDKTIFTVTSYVDAQNSFGAMIRSYFQATYNWDGSSETWPILTNLIIE